MITEAFAKEFAGKWVAAWNNHDMEAIMEHYAEEIVFLSPVIVRLNNDETGTINNKPALRDYFERALALYPDLRFEFYSVLTSMNSVVLYYKSVNELLAAEFMEIGVDGKVVRVCAHYSKQ